MGQCSGMTPEPPRLAAVSRGNVASVLSFFPYPRLPRKDRATDAPNSGSYSAVPWIEIAVLALVTALGIVLMFVLL